MKKFFFLFLLIVFFVFGMVNIAFSGSPSMDQVVTYSVDSISIIAVTGAPVLSINQSTLDPDGPNPSVTATGTYSVWTNKNGQKITGAITSGGDMPTGLVLEVEMTATLVGTSTGKKILTTSAVDLVTGISKKKGNALTITYTFTADPTADPVTNQTRTITYTITD